MSPLDEAIIAEMTAFVKEGHAGQVDLGGAPYEFHLIAVAERLRPFGDTSLVKCALGHDFIEDVPDGKTKIFSGPLTEYEIKIIQSLSMPEKPRGMDYTSFYLGIYITSLVSKGELRAILVKLSDNLNNSDPERHQGNTKRDVLRSYRYMESMKRCLAACEFLIHELPGSEMAFYDLKRDVEHRIELLRERCIAQREYIDFAGFEIH
ncbi:hypothetical protein RYA05_00660 [Pseudomonas syringae pv. actinidiae]|nr:hypothetical protein [Pseudomonas syringae pv. actinidiae]